MYVHNQIILQSSGGFHAVSAPYPRCIGSGVRVGEVVYPKDVQEVCAFAKVLMHRLMRQISMFFKAFLEAAFGLSDVTLSATGAFDAVDDPILLGVRYPVFHAADFGDLIGGSCWRLCYIRSLLTIYTTLQWHHLTFLQHFEVIRTN